MRRFRHARGTVRAAQFERYEERLVFSTVPWLDICPAPVPDLIGTLPGHVQISPAAVSDNSWTSGQSDVAYVHSTYGLRGAGQTVAVIDSGIAYDHVALGGGLGAGYRVVGGWDFTEEKDANPYDDAPGGFHGTHVSGIIASQDPVRTGVAPDVDLVALRVFNDMGMGYTAWVEQALTWVHQHRNDFRYPITTVNLSLGAQWNGSAPPAWATLEDKLAELVNDGIFVSVAAGNSFASYGVPGLAYPAASPHVVPVASVNAAGQLSGFSQRQQRVLATPGEQITSTVPDFIFGADGNPNDWATASGTSMAAPYLAGASVLVREALAFVGDASIAQSDIYQHLRNTADLVFDSATNVHYHRVNLARAIDTIIPADDYGSTLAESYNLGYLSDPLNVSGHLTRLDDADAFQFTATASGLLTWHATGSQSFDVTVISPEFAALSDQQVGSLRVEAGGTYTVLVSARDRLANYELRLSLTPDKLVSIDGNVVRVQGTAGDDVIRFWIDSHFRLDVNGQTYAYARNMPWRFEMDGGGGTDRLRLSGSQGDDEVVLRAGVAEMRGGGYELSATAFRDITALAGGGRDDVARLFDTAGNDEFIASHNGALLRGAGYINQVSGFDRVYATATTGANDVARFHDSAGSDEYIASPDNSVMRGKGYYNKASGFDQTYAYGSGSGDDVARFWDSAGNDQFVADARAASMSGGGYYNKATNFARTYAYATLGGNDSAELYDSAGRDLFVACAGESYLRGSGYYNKAIGFDRVYAYATPGQDDVARFYDTRDNEVFVGGAASSVLSGSDYCNQAFQFRRVYAYASAGGYDVAQLQSGRNIERVIVGSDRQVLRGDGFYADARGFACGVASVSTLAGDQRPPAIEPQGDRLADHTLSLPVAAVSRPVGPFLPDSPVLPGSPVPHPVDLADGYFWPGMQQGIAGGHRNFYHSLATGTSLTGGDNGEQARGLPDSFGAAWPAGDDPAGRSPRHVRLATDGSTREGHNPLDVDQIALQIQNGEIGERYLSALDILFACLAEPEIPLCDSAA